MPSLPKPTSIRLVESGNKLRARYRRRAEREPMPAEGAGPVPEEFTPEQRTAWLEVVEASPAGLLRRMDRQLLKSYAITVAVRDAALRQFNEEGSQLLVAGADPRYARVANPLWREYRRCIDVLRQLGQELGCSPAARTRIEVDPPAPEEDVLAKFFGVR